MVIKEILLYMNDRETRTATLDAAMKIAEQHQAHLTGLYLIPPPAIPSYALAQIPEEVFENQRRELARLAAQAETEFRAALDGADCRGEWHQLEGFPEPLLNRQARFADRTAYGCRARTVRARQGRPRIPGRDQPQPSRDRRRGLDRGRGA